jgi:hypothetical protein
MHPGQMPLGTRIASAFSFGMGHLLGREYFQSRIRRGLSNGGVCMTNLQAHRIVGDTAVFAKCRGDKKFPYVVALARAVNALNSAHSLMESAADKNTPAATRDQWNSYFFVSAILYESLNLIRAMGPVFGKEKIFQDTIQTLLKDKTALAKHSPDEPPQRQRRAS